MDRQNNKQVEDYKTMSRDCGMVNFFSILCTLFPDPQKQTFNVFYLYMVLSVLLAGGQLNYTSKQMQPGGYRVCETETNSYYGKPFF